MPLEVVQQGRKFILFTLNNMLINPFWFSSIISSDYAFQEDFEGAGMPVNFVEYGGTQTRNYDYSVSPLQGSQSYFIDSTTTSSPRGNVWSNALDTNAFSVYFMWRRDNDPTAVAAIWQKIRKIDNATQNSLSLNNTTSSLILRNGNSISGTGSYLTSIGVTYHIWIDVDAITGNLSVFINTDSNKPLTPALTQTGYNPNSPVSSDTGGVVFCSMRSMECVFDKIRIKTNGIIGSNPS
jgi:hypothetical protein